MDSWPTTSVPRLPHTATSVPGLQLFDSARMAVVPVGPSEGTAGLYVCGITPYDATHLGHAFTYLTFDLVQRVWRDQGLAVNYVQNITDVDDPLLERAADTGVSWEDLAQSQIDLFRADMTALRVLPPDHYIGVIECVPCVIALMGDLNEAGSVYQVADPEYPDWYFRCTATPGFGEVSHLDRAEQLAVFAERGGDPDRPGKVDPLDCLVWRMERPGEPAWDSPWGRGRPGWHIECTAIALRYLGADFDVQGGGSDLVFPHHEMCAAEGLAAAREPFAQAFVHSGMVGLDGVKMSKSLGNLELVSRLLNQGADPMAVRLALIDQHYRHDWMWTPEHLNAATARLQSWRAAVSTGRGPDPVPVLAAMRDALRTDLDAPGAIAAVDEWAAAVAAGAGDDPTSGLTVAAAVDALLGIEL